MTSILNYFSTTELSALGVIVSIASFLSNSGVLIATIAYVRTTQKQVKFLIRSQEKNEMYTSKKIMNDTLIDLVRTWNSRDSIVARNIANRTLREMGFGPEDVYNKLNAVSGIGPESTWIHLSLIAHFIARVSLLLQNRDIDFGRTKTEFGDTFHHWSSILSPILRTLGSEDRISSLIEDAHKILNPGISLHKYPYKNS